MRRSVVESVIAGVAFALAACAGLAVLFRDDPRPRRLATITFVAFAIASGASGALAWRFVAAGRTARASAARGAAIGTFVWVVAHPCAWFATGLFGSTYAEPPGAPPFGAADRLAASLAGAALGWFTTGLFLLPPALVAGAALGWIAARRADSLAVAGR